VAIAKDGTVYYSYVDARNNHIHQVRSRDRGLTWERDVDLGALAHITAAQFPAVVAGDPDRAAVAFFGTTYNGDGVDTASNFEGTWQLFVAATYDGGLTYHVVDTKPGDPIQKGGICASGFCRNLLDFFDASIDPQGRIIVGYEDGCVGGCPQGMPGTFSDQAVVARQSGGRRMFAAFDPAEPARQREAHRQPLRLQALLRRYRAGRQHPLLLPGQRHQREGREPRRQHPGAVGGHQRTDAGGRLRSAGPAGGGGPGR
jgi:hypothetical protein